MDLDRLRRLAESATPGPWLQGDLTEASVNRKAKPVGTAKIQPGTCWLDRDYGLVGNDYIDREPVRIEGDRHWHLAHTSGWIIAREGWVQVVGETNDWPDN